MSLLHADVAVIGSELCGWAAASLLACENRRVVVLADDEQVDARPLGDWLVPLVPALWRMPTSGPVSWLLDQLGLRQRARLVLGEPVGVGLIDDPDIRMVLELDDDKRHNELKRVFADAAEAAFIALRDVQADARDCLLGEAGLLHEQGFFAVRRARKRREAYGPAGDPVLDDASVRALVKTPLGAALPYVVPFVQSAHLEGAPGIAGWLAAWQLCGGTLGNPQGGLSLRDALRNLFAEVIRGHGGEVLQSGTVEAITSDGKRVNAIQTAGKNDYAVRAVIDATSRRDLGARLAAGKRRDKYVAEEASVPVAAGAAIVRWLLPRALLPRGLPPRAVILPEEVGGTPLLLGVFEGLVSAEGGKKRADDSVVAVVALRRAGTADPETAADDIEERLGRLFPFVRGSVIAYDRVTGADAAAALPAYQPSDEVHPLGGRRPTTPFANVARAGRDVVPRLGVEGELAAARSVAAIVQQALGNPKEAA